MRGGKKEEGGRSCRGAGVELQGSESERLRLGLRLQVDGCKVDELTLSFQGWLIRIRVRARVIIRARVRVRVRVRVMATAW